MHLRVLASIAIGIVTISCSAPDSVPEKLSDYQQRLANILDLSPPAIPPLPTLAYPKKKQLTNTKQTTQIKLFEFYTLKHCRLYSLIADRNTSLGRVQLPSVRYRYEQDLLLAFDECIADTQDLALKQKLRDWRAAKASNLPLVWADVIQQSSEIRHALSSTSLTLQGNASDGLGPSLNALQQLTYTDQLQAAGDSSNNLELSLKALQDYTLPAKVMTSQRALAQHLVASNQWLEQHQPAFTCRNGRPSTQQTYLANVFQRYFIEGIQPLASALNHYHYQLAPLLQAWLDSEHLAPSFKHFIRQRFFDDFVQYQQAMTAHVQFWQGFYKACGIKPGG